MELVELILKAQVQSGDEARGSFAFHNDEHESVTTVWSNFRSVHALDEIRRRIASGVPGAAILRLDELYERIELLEKGHAHLRSAIVISLAALAVALFALIWTEFPTELAGFAAELWKSQGGLFWPIAAGIGLAIGWIVSRIRTSQKKSAIVVAGCHEAAFLSISQVRIHR